MQKVEFYCKNCKKSMKMAYELTGDIESMVMNGIILRCHTHKCIRAVMLKNFTEGTIKAKTDKRGKCYL